MAKALETATRAECEATLRGEVLKGAVLCFSKKLTAYSKEGEEGKEGRRRGERGRRKENVTPVSSQLNFIHSLAHLEQSVAGTLMTAAPTMCASRKGLGTRN